MKGEDLTQRDHSGDKYGIKTSPKIEEKTLYANLLNAQKGNKIASYKNSKRSRGSQEKYSGL